jgi:polyribonucleotide nucleotidyltransferase
MCNTTALVTVRRDLGKLLATRAGASSSSRSNNASITKSATRKADTNTTFNSRTSSSSSSTNTAGVVTSSDRDAAQQLIVRQSVSKEMIQVGDLLDGMVTSLQPYGVFVKLGEGIQALLHISQITAQQLTSPAQVLAVRAIQRGMWCMQAYCSTFANWLCKSQSPAAVPQ